MFLFLAFGGTHIANLPNSNIVSSDGTSMVNTANLAFISLAFGLSLAINAWIFFRVSGALFNPAISFSLALVRVISPLRAVLLSISQILGGIVAAALIDVLMPGQLNVSTNLGGGINTAQGNAIPASSETRTVSGNVSYVTTCPSCIYDRCRETQINVPRSNWNWFHSLYWRSCRRILHRRKSQPRKEFWTMCCHSKFPYIPLDLLYFPTMIL